MVGHRSSGKGKGQSVYRAFENGDRESDGEGQASQL